jgi:hypothetical protein
MTSDPPSDQTAVSRRKRMNAADEASIWNTKPIANWQARFAWSFATWGLVPVLGLPLGLLGLVFGLAGLHRVHGRPDDLGLRHAIGAVMLGGLEILFNGVGTVLVVKGVLVLTQ